MVVPAGINNAFPISSIKMMIPLLQYRITKKEKYLTRTALHMALDKAVLDEDTLDIVKDSFDNVKTKVGMPTNIQEKKLSGYYAPTLVIVSENVLPEFQYCGISKMLMECVEWFRKNIDI